MTRADWKETRHGQTSPRQPPDIHVRVVSASELQSSSSSSALRYAGHWGVLKRMRKKTRVAVVQFETENGTRDNVVFSPQDLMFVCEMKTVLKLECRDSRRYLSLTEEEEGEAKNDETEHKSKNKDKELSKWERIDNQDGRWKVFAETDAAKLESAWKRMQVLVRSVLTYISSFSK